MTRGYQQFHDIEIKISGGIMEASIIDGGLVL
jgi:hypothetical protein